MKATKTASLKPSSHGDDKDGRVVDIRRRAEAARSEAATNDRFRGDEPDVLEAPDRAGIPPGGVAPVPALGLEPASGDNEPVAVDIEPPKGRVLKKVKKAKPSAPRKHIPPTIEAPLSALLNALRSAGDVGNRRYSAMTAHIRDQVSLVSKERKKARKTGRAKEEEARAKDRRQKLDTRIAAAKKRIKDLECSRKEK